MRAQGIEFKNSHYALTHNSYLAIVRLSEYNHAETIREGIDEAMEYMSAPQAAEKWGISERRVQILCKENRIPGASKLGYMWLIPKDAEKPVDGRRKSFGDKKE